MKLKLSFKFIYANYDEGVANVEYRIRSYPTTYPTIASTLTKSGDRTNKIGLSKIFEINGFNGYILIEIKGLPTKYKEWKVVKKLNIDTGAYILKSINYEELIKVKLPVEKIGVFKTEAKGVNGTERSDLYEVQSGDTVESIAKKFNKSKERIMLDNGLSHEFKIYKGQRLYIGDKPIKISEPKLIGPDKEIFIKSSHIVRYGDTLSSIAKEYSLNINEIAFDNKIKITDTLKIGQILILNNRNYFKKAFTRQEIDIEINRRAFYGSTSGFPVHMALKQKATQASVSLGADFFNFVGSFELGFAYDLNGNKMLYVSTIEQIDLSQNLINNIVSDVQSGKGTVSEVIESYKKKGILKKRKWSKEEIKKHLKKLSFSIGDSIVITNAQHVEDLTGSGYSVTNTVKLLIADLSRVNTIAETADGRTIRGKGYGAGTAIGSKKASSIANEKTHISASLAQSQTYGLLIIDPYRRFSKKHFDRDPIVEIDLMSKD